MGLKGQLEAIIYAAEEPVSLEQLTLLLKDSVVSENGLAQEGAEPAALQAEVKNRIRTALEELAHEYETADRGVEVRQIAGGWRMATKPEHHDLVRSFAKSLKPPIRLSLQALETLAVIAYKQPVTAPEIGEIRGVDSGGVLATLIDRKLITTAGRKQVIGRPILYKTTKEFLVRFGLKDVHELPSIEEFEKLIAGGMQEELFAKPAAESRSAPPEPQSAFTKAGSDSAEAEAPDGSSPEVTPAESISYPETETVAAESASQEPGNVTEMPERVSPENTHSGDEHDQHDPAKVANE